MHQKYRHAFYRALTHSHTVSDRLTTVRISERGKSSSIIYGDGQCAGLEDTPGVISPGNHSKHLVGVILTLLIIENSDKDTLPLLTGAKSELLVDRVIVQATSYMEGDWRERERQYSAVGPSNTVQNTLCS